MIVMPTGIKESDYRPLTRIQLKEGVSITQFELSCLIESILSLLVEESLQAVPTIEGLNLPAFTNKFKGGYEVNYKPNTSSSSIPEPPLFTMKLFEDWHGKCVEMTVYSGDFKTLDSIDVNIWVRKTLKRMERLYTGTTVFKVDLSCPELINVIDDLCYEFDTFVKEHRASRLKNVQCIGRAKRKLRQLI